MRIVISRGAVDNYQLVKKIVPIWIIFFPILLYQTIVITSSTKSSSVLLNCIQLYTGMIDYWGYSELMRVSLNNALLFGPTAYDFNGKSAIDTFKLAYSKYNDELVPLFQEMKKKPLGNFTDTYLQFISKSSFCEVYKKVKLSDVTFMECLRGSNISSTFGKDIYYVMKEYGSAMQEASLQAEQGPLDPKTLGQLVTSPRFEPFLYMGIWSQFANVIRNGLTNSLLPQIQVLIDKAKLDKVNCGSSCGLGDLMNYNSDVVAYAIFAVSMVIVTLILLRSFVVDSLILTFEAHTCASLFLSARMISENPLLASYNRK